MRLSLLILATLCAAACASTQQAGDSVQTESTRGLSGSQLLSKYCSECHAVGRSDISRHPDAPAFRTLSRSYPILSLEESLAEGIVVGHPDMPEFQFEADDVASIISYLQSIQQR